MTIGADVAKLAQKTQVNIKKKKGKKRVEKRVEKITLKDFKSL